MSETSAAVSQVFTIGHSNQSLESLLNLLSQHQIALLADVRSYPRSRYASQFDRERLSQTLAARSIRYVYLGKDLGGRPSGDEYYDDHGHVLYSRVAASDFFDRGIKQLEEAI